MTTLQRPEPGPMLDDLTVAITVAVWKEAHDISPEPTHEYCLSPGELHGMTPRLAGHLGVPMVRRGRRRQARGELVLAH